MFHLYGEKIKQFQPKMNNKAMMLLSLIISSIILAASVTGEQEKEDNIVKEEIKLQKPI